MNKRHAGGAVCVAAWLCFTLSAAGGEVSVWHRAEDHARKANAAVTYCLRYAEGWLQQADPRSGLLPRNLNQDAYWNAKDCAADNFPFLLLTGELTGQHHILCAANAIFDQERRLCPRVGSLPDTFFFDRQGFSAEEPKIDDLIFGAAEYAKDGLLPIIEWVGPGPWLDRAQEMVADIWQHAAFETPCGTLPSSVLEVNGDLLQVTSRLYWMTGDARYRKWAFALADYYLLHKPLVDGERIPLRDHGCEILGGLSEAYVIAWKTDAARHAAYRGPMHRLLDTILEQGVYSDGMLPNWFNPRTGEKAKDTVSDGWGYVYNAFLTVAWVDGHAPYRDAAQQAVKHAHTHLGTNWEGYSGDGYADSVEGAINLLNRIPCETAWPWVEASLGLVQGLQCADGIAEGWYGDGNSVRHDDDVCPVADPGDDGAPLRKDVNLGAVRDADGSLCVFLSSEWDWNGTLHCDLRRHRDWLHMPLDYPRINQFPEWFTVDKTARYRVRENDGPARDVTGDQLANYSVTLPENGSLRLIIQPLETGADIPADADADTSGVRWREQAFTAHSAEEAERWGRETRAVLAAVLGINECACQWGNVPLDAREAGTVPAEGFRLAEVEMTAFPDRRIRVLVGTPEHLPAAGCPAVVCIGGHGSKPSDVFDTNSIYHGFAAALARRRGGDFSRHRLSRPGRALQDLDGSAHVGPHALCRLFVCAARGGFCPHRLCGTIAGW